MKSLVTKSNKQLKKWQKALIGIGIPIGVLLLLFVILCVAISIKSGCSSNDVSNRVSFVVRLSDPSAKTGRSIAPSGRRSIAVNRSDAAWINAFFKLVMVNLQVGFLIIVNSVY